MAAPILWAPGIFLVLSAGKTAMPIKFLLLGGGGSVLGFFRGGGWKCQFYFYGRGDFSELSKIRRLFVTCDAFARYFFVAFRGPHLPASEGIVFVPCPRLLRGPRFGRILRVLALHPPRGPCETS